MHNIHTGSKYEGSFIRNSDNPKITADKPRPKLQANFFWTAPMGNGDCFLTNRYPINNVGENLGLINIPIKKFNIRKPAIKGMTI